MQPEQGISHFCQIRREHRLACFMQILPSHIVDRSKLLLYRLPGVSRQCMQMPHAYRGLCLNFEETPQLRRKATWEKGPTTEPRTRDLGSNADFQPRELRNQPRSFIPNRPLMCQSRVCRIHDRDRFKTRDLEAGNLCAGWYIVGPQA